MGGFAGLPLDCWSSNRSPAARPKGMARLARTAYRGRLREGGFGQVCSHELNSPGAACASA